MLSLGIFQTEKKQNALSNIAYSACDFQSKEKKSKILLKYE